MPSNYVASNFLLLLASGTSAAPQKHSLIILHPRPLSLGPLTMMADPELQHCQRSRYGSFSIVSTHPSFHDNIALGDLTVPWADKEEYDDRVRSAARLAGAEELIDKLPDGFDTYLERPVSDEYSYVVEGTETWAGRAIGFGALREAAKIRNEAQTSLSGGQMQRLAVAQTLMCSVV
ncbi:hypothetical protein C8Q74DRAFT_1440392 [Fomes fomentarius]|nr:hypothetical protein C8Q74DRAFT_1440392 [Fomes fomentarius]